MKVKRNEKCCRTYTNSNLFLATLRIRRILGHVSQWSSKTSICQIFLINSEFSRTLVETSVPLGAKLKQTSKT
jgi:hypothetical protein